VSERELARGPVVLGIEGLALTEPDRSRLLHPQAGGAILFARNFESGAQLRALTASIRALRSPSLLICVDHEGGRVQRFRDGFTAIPAMRTLGDLWERDVAKAAAEAQRLGALLARELRDHGVDFSLTPVLDLDFGASAVIGDRALHGNPNAVAHLASCLRRGLNAGGCAAVGKHFPGHGFVAADSHDDLPVDERTLDALAADDLIPYAVLAREGLEAVMPAHVVYPAVDKVAAGFSRIWLQDILRARLGFDGMVFSDDLGMAGATGAGDMLARASTAQAAGCDMVLVCNDPEAAELLLDRWRPARNADLARRAARMEGVGPPT
jgi:beta-N-acetylhexosaminidase